MTNDYQIDIKLKDSLTGNDVFVESYKIALRKEFVENTAPKEHGFKPHVESFVMQLKKNCTKPAKKPLKKRDIYVVKFGLNI